MLAIRSTVVAVCSVLFLVVSPSAGAQTFPSKPITIVAPYPPGGATDLYARAVGNGLSELGQPAIVENKAGASGLIGAEYVSRQPADGYSLLIGASSMFSILPQLNPRMKDIARRVEPVSLLGLNPSYVVVPASLPCNTIEELIAYLKAKPGAYGYGSAGKGTSQHVFMELFKQKAGVDAFAVQYKGSGPMVVDLIAGRVVMAIEQGPAVLSQIKAGKLKALAVTTAKRTQAMPNIPTLSETVLPGFDAVTWFALYAPAGTPRNVIDKLLPQVAKTLGSRELKERMNAYGVEPTASSPEDVAKRQAAETKLWSEVISKSHITLDE